MPSDIRYTVYSGSTIANYHLQIPNPIGKCGFHRKNKISEVPYVIDKFGAPGEIRTPDYLVGSQVLKSALQSIKAEVFLNACSHRIRNHKEFYH